MRCLLAASRASGSWIGLKLAGDVAEASATVEVGPERAAFQMPESGDVHVRPRDRALDQEKRLVAKRRALLAFVRANYLDRQLGARENAKVGLVAVGCYCWHVRRKRLRFHHAREEEEHILPTIAEPKPHHQQIYHHPSNGLARKLKNIGMASIGLRPPLIRTRSVG